MLEAQHVLVRKHGHGIYVSPRVHRKTIAVLLDSSFFQSPGISPVWGMLFGILAQEAEKRTEKHDQDFEFHMTATVTGTDAMLPSAVMKSVESGAVQGVLGIGLSNEAAAWLTAQHIPFVAYGGRAPWCVLIDYGECCRLAVRSLATQGCRRVGFWSLGEHPSAAISEGFMKWYRNLPDWFAENGLEVDPALQRSATYGGPTPTAHLRTNQQQGYDLAMSVFGSPDSPKPDGLFIDDDMLTNGALIAFERLGLCVGRDIKIASHANAGSIVLFGHEDHLTLVEVDPAGIVREMFNALDLLLDDREPAEPYALVKPALRPPSPGASP
jgi:DNA-binding LacI/PurR family transcriptional regulator